MFEYKVDIYKLKYAEEAMNAYAKAGWRVKAVTPYHMDGFVVVFYEREAAEDQEISEVELSEEAKPVEIPDAEGKPDVADSGNDIFGVFDSFETETE